VTDREKVVQDLERVNEAIKSVELDGQEITFNGRKIRRADLRLLYDQRKELQNKLDTIGDPYGGGGRVGVATWSRR
jgi:hypothetical protein